MNDDQKKMLTEFLGECWHEFRIPNILGGNMCIHCNKNISNLYSWRTFLTPNDQQACKDKLVEKEMWHEFQAFTANSDSWLAKPIDGDLYDEDATWDSDFELWLFRPTDESGEPHFCRLVAEFLEGRK